MSNFVNFKIVKTIAGRTFRQSIESPIAYVAGIFFYGFLGIMFGVGFFPTNLATIGTISYLAPWILWFVIPILTMGLISEEIRSGTFEHLSTLPLRDWEIVLGKYFGFVGLAIILIGGLAFFPIVVSFLVDHPAGLDWGGVIGTLSALFLLTLMFGAIGLFSSSLARNQVVVLILGMILCTFFFFAGKFMNYLPPILSQMFDFIGVNSHMNALNRGVWDLRDLLYFLSMIIIFLYLTATRLATRRF